MARYTGLTAMKETIIALRIMSALHNDVSLFESKGC